MKPNNGMSSSKYTIPGNGEKNGNRLSGSDTDSSSDMPNIERN